MPVEYACTCRDQSIVEVDRTVRNANVEILPPSRRDLKLGVSLAPFHHAFSGIVSLNTLQTIMFRVPSQMPFIVIAVKNGLKPCLTEILYTTHAAAKAHCLRRLTLSGSLCAQGDHDEITRSPRRYHHPDLHLRRRKLSLSCPTVLRELPLAGTLVSRLRLHHRAEP